MRLVNRKIEQARTRFEQIRKILTNLGLKINFRVLFRYLAFCFIYVVKFFAGIIQNLTACLRCSDVHKDI